MITYQQEFLCNLEENFGFLLSKELEGVNPNKAIEYMDKYSDNSVLVTARNSGVLVGYIGWIKFVPPMGESLYAQSVGWFVLPKQKPMVGINLLKKSQEFLKEDGVDKLLLGVREGDFSRVMSRYGYSKEEVIYSKDL